MSATITEDDEDLRAAEDKPSNGHAISDEDLRDLLTQEKAARAKAERLVAAERDQRSRAERERDEARGAVSTAVDGRWQAEEQSLATELESAQTEAASLEEQIARLSADGDHAGVAKASRALARAEARIINTEQKQQWLTQAREAAKVAPVQQQRQTGGVDLSQFSAKQRQWIEDNPDYMTDERLRKRIAAAHYAAVAEDIPVDSDDYFSFLDERKHPASRQRQEDPPEPRQRREAGGGLPVQRRSATNTGPRQGEVRLSPEQREAADFSMPEVPLEDYQEGGIVKPGRYRRYAQNMARLRSEGRLT